MKVEVIEAGSIISNGLHHISGIGEFHRKADCCFANDIDGYVFCIDGKNYEAYVDPDDGYRSYSALNPSNEKCDITFDPQPVYAINKKVTGYLNDNDPYGWAEDKNIFVLLDAVNNQVVLEVGTDYSEDYYPCGFCHWKPEHLEVNKGK